MQDPSHLITIITATIYEPLLRAHAAPSTLHTSSHLILPPALANSYCSHPHFSDENAKTVLLELLYPVIQGQERQGCTVTQMGWTLMCREGKRPGGETQQLGGAAAGAGQQDSLKRGPAAVTWAVQAS